MSAIWTSSTGILLRDRVPAALRRVEQGRCAGRDPYASLSSAERHPP